MKICVVCAPGVGDLLIMHIASYELQKAGHDVITVSPHRFGKWLEEFQFGSLESSDAIFLQHDNSETSKEIKKNSKTVYTFYGSHKLGKHPPLQKGFDYVCNPKKTMVENVRLALKDLFEIDASGENGMRAPEGLIWKKHEKRIAIHAGSSNPNKNWPLSKFTQFASWAKKKGFDPIFLPQFPSLEKLTSFIYESSLFLGNDSGPGHIASCLKIPNLIIGKDFKQMRLWRPGWGQNKVITPPQWVPNFKKMRLRETYWSKLITVNSVVKKFAELSDFKC